MAITVTVSVARATLPDLLNRVIDGEEVTITRHGRPVAVLAQPPAVRNPRAAAAFAGADEIGRRLEEARSRPLRLEGALDPAYAKELIAEIRRDRDSD